MQGRQKEREREGRNVVSAQTSPFKRWTVMGESVEQLLSVPVTNGDKYRISTIKFQKLVV